MLALRMLTFKITMSTQLCPRRFFLDLYRFQLTLSTKLYLRGQIVDILSSVDKILNSLNFHKSLFYKGLLNYFPQQFLYFLPLPQGHSSLRPIFLGHLARS